MFDQYSRPKNNLTLALYCTLRRKPQLVVLFIKWIRVALLVADKTIEFVEQQIPGTPTRGDEGEGEGLSDLCF
ncbi:hypothetical protein ETAA8_39860 [Anatilimnocola aggregata]|uniref:Uncharacterized protein n=1 Tax=Anatilimnocola aggregata TaxID=2528021 RepID=A0A517YF75_9BACT|nr:hypothetical protein [Anatilimnocola aggregata]QDU28880.1 hypothetical protein ETAA8_39860 [Anatilimnocola aggregata]